MVLDNVTLAILAVDECIGRSGRAVIIGVDFSTDKTSPLASLSCFASDTGVYKLRYLFWLRHTLHESINACILRTRSSCT